MQAQIIGHAEFAERRRHVIDQRRAGVIVAWLELWFPWVRWRA